MSVSIIKPLTFQRIYCTLEHVRTTYPLNDQLSAGGFTLHRTARTIDDPTAGLVQRLHVLAQRHFAQTYAHLMADYPQSQTHLDLVSDKAQPYPTLTALSKALDFVIYQLGEEDAPEVQRLNEAEQATLRHLYDLAKALRRAILSASPAYAEADWGD